MRELTFVIANFDKSGFSVASVTFSTDKRNIQDASDFKRALKEAVTDWMENSEEGQGVASANPDGFHVGHLALYIGDAEDLDNYLEDQGIHDLEIWTASNDDAVEGWPYGENLVDQDRVVLGEGYEETDGADDDGADDDGDDGDDDAGDSDAGDSSDDDAGDSSDEDDDRSDLGVELEDGTLLQYPDDETGRIRQLDEDDNLIAWRDPDDDGYDDWNDEFDEEDRWVRPDEDEEDEEDEDSTSDDDEEDEEDDR